MTLRLVDLSANAFVAPFIANPISLSIPLPQEIFEKMILTIPREKRTTSLFYARISWFPVAELRVPFFWKIDAVALKALRFREVAILDIRDSLSSSQDLLVVAKYCSKTLQSLQTNFYPTSLNAIFQVCSKLTDLTLRTSGIHYYGLYQFAKTNLQFLTLEITDGWLLTDTLLLSALIKASPLLEYFSVIWKTKNEIIETNFINAITPLKKIAFLNANISGTYFINLLFQCRNLEVLKIVEGRTATSTIAQICQYGQHIKHLHFEGFADPCDFLTGNWDLESLAENCCQLLKENAPNIKVAHLSFKKRQVNIRMTDVLPFQ